MEIKRKFYIFSFTILGLLLGFLAKELFEIGYTHLLISDFNSYSFGLSWQDLVQFNFLLSIALISACGFWGVLAGQYWWKQIYVLQKYKSKRWRSILK